MATWPSLHRSLLTAFAAGAVAASAFAQGDATDPLVRLVRSAVRPLLQHPDAEVAGEALLIVAAAGDPADYPATLAKARTTTDGLGLHAILALGELGAAGAGLALSAMIDTRGEPDDERSAAAAFALTLLPPDAVGAALTQLLTTLQQGSPRRQQATTAALLLGLRRNPHRDLGQALRGLWDERARQLGDLRAPLLEVIAAGELDDRPMWRERLLARNPEPALQLALLRAYVGREERLPAETVLLAKRSDDPAVRAAALRLLIGARQATALDVSIAALSSQDPDELHAAVRGVVTLGGAKFAATLEPHLLGQADDTRRAALLAAFTAPPSEALRDRCGAWAADRRQDAAVRRHAALLLARAEPARAAPLLRDLFVEERDPSAKKDLASALLGPGMSPPALDRLVADGDAGRLAEAWHPLLAAGHPEAERRLLALLAERQPPLDELRAALRAWRLHAVLGVAPAAAAALSPGLRQLLADTP